MSPGGYSAIAGRLRDALLVAQHTGTPCSTWVPRARRPVAAGDRRGDRALADQEVSHLLIYPIPSTLVTIERRSPRIWRK